MISKISSAQNPKIKLIKSLLQKKNRVSSKMFTVEGIKSVQDAILSGVHIEMIAMSEKFATVTETDNFSCFECIIVPDSIFEGLCDTKTPQGILAVISIDDKEFRYTHENLYIYCDRLQDPGNLGTIIRTADAAGVGAVLLSKGCAEAYSPKVVRSSMGSFFHIPIFENVGEHQLKEMKNAGFKLFSGALGQDAREYTLADYTIPSIICVGNEANGISEEIIELSDYLVKIPVVGKAESLNAGVAASILIYEALRQRRIKN